MAGQRHSHAHTTQLASPCDTKACAVHNGWQLFICPYSQQVNMVQLPYVTCCVACAFQQHNTNEFHIQVLCASTYTYSTHEFYSGIQMYSVAIDIIIHHLHLVGSTCPPTAQAAIIVCPVQFVRAANCPLLQGPPDNCSGVSRSNAASRSLQMYRIMWCKWAAASGWTTGSYWKNRGRWRYMISAEHGIEY